MGEIYEDYNETGYDDEEEEEDGDGEGRGRPMLGFMFGNVDDSGDLDEEYLDQDAKERLSALAGRLPSFVDIELYAKKKKLAERNGIEEHEDYDQKAEDAVDYEDIQEQYDGPEVQIAPQEMQFYAQVALAGVPKIQEDDYDEDEDEDEDEDSAEQAPETQPESPTIVPELPVEASVAEEECRTSVVDVLASDEDAEENEEDWEQGIESQDTPSLPKVPEAVVAKVELPVLCQEDGKTVLRFSELFGVREPYWVIGQRKGRPKRNVAKEKHDRPREDQEAMEDDEETVLKMCSQLPVPVADSSAEGDSETESNPDESNDWSGKEEGMKTIPVLSHYRNGRSKPKRAAFIPAEPMKEDILAWEVDIADCRRSIPAANFDLIHQQEWEANIVWDKRKSTRGSSPANWSGGKHVVEVDSEDEQSCVLSSSHEQASSDEFEQGSTKKSSWRRPLLVEPLCRPSSSDEDLDEPTQTSRHPQLLRLGTVSFAKDPEGEISDGIMKRISKVTLETKEKNLELAGGDWLTKISWEKSGSCLPRSQIIFDMMDPQMVFEVSDTKEGQSIRLHAAAVLINPRGKEGVPDGGEGTINASVPLTKFNISNDKYYTNKKTHQQQKSNAKKRAIHGVKVMHSLPAIKLQTMKPKLSKKGTYKFVCGILGGASKDLANFHRPKAVWYPHHNEVAAKEQGKLAAKGIMKIILKTLGGKGSKLTIDASDTLSILKAKITKKLGDLKPSEKSKVFYFGKELVERFTFAQQQVPPNSVLHLVRTKIYPWPKAQRLPGENKPLRPPGAFKKKSELSVKDGHVALMEYCEERPLLLGNVGMGSRLYTYYRKRTPTDATATTLRAERGPWVGITLPLEPTEDSPFLGDIRPGETQSSLETNMYRAPIFAHKVATTDFLLVRSPKGTLSLRRIDSVHVVGQQEPHMEVLTPTSKLVQNYVGNRLLVYLYREFREKEKPGNITPYVRAEDLTSQFPSLTEGFMRKRLKHCAELQRYGGEMCWLMRRNFRIPSEEEMRRMVTPENVCTYESMQAGLHHLKRMGVQKLTQPSSLATAMNQLPDEAITLAAASHIERELQITPWNLSSNFVAATMQGRGSLERLEIVGPGDPSGRGLGFSYLRVATKPPNAGALVEKKAAAARGGGAVTGTDADLRRLSMEAAREVLVKFKVPEDVIDKLTRWHRIAMVRKLSSEQAASGVKLGAAALNKFARGQRMSFLQLQQQTREKCQDIWDRQAQSLSITEGDDSESDGEANGDLDSFAGDLENLLEAEEGDEGGGKRGRREGMGGLGARRRKQLAQQEEDIEDEEAEAAELRRMLRADDEAEEEQKKKKGGTVTKEKKEVQKKETITDVGGDAAGKKKKRILKRIIRTKKPDGTYTSKEIIITDPKEVALYLAKKNALKAANQKGGVDKDKSGKKGPGKSSQVVKKVKKGGAAVKEVKMPAKGKVNGKFGRDAFSLVCGACGQLGHMRTNKKCPLYMEDGEPVAWQDQGAAAEGLVERQGTKITIKRKSLSTKTVEELDSPKSVQAPPPKVPLPKNDSKTPPPPPAKLPSLKIRLLTGNSSQISTDDASAPPVKKSVKGKPERRHSGDANVTGDSGARPPLLKLKLKQKQEQEQMQLKKEQEAEEERKRIRREQEAYEAALLEERLREERELERREKLSNASNGVKSKRLLPVKTLKKKAVRVNNDSESIKRKERERVERERQREAEEYQRALAEEMEREQEELDRKMAEEERVRAEQEERSRQAHEKAERDRQKQIRIKEKKREILQAEAKIREAEMKLEREERERKAKEDERGRLRDKQVKMKNIKEKVRVMAGSTTLPNVKDRGKGIKRRPEAHVPTYHQPTPESGNVQKRIRKRGGQVELCNILEGVLEFLKNADCSFLFRKPVPKKDAPDYHYYVQQPMDLSKIRERVRKLKYNSRSEFRQDVQQIADNAHIYNDGRNPGIPPLADRLLELCDEELEARDVELDEAESGIEPLEDNSRGNSPRLDRRRSVHML